MKRTNRWTGLAALTLTVSPWLCWADEPSSRDAETAGWSAQPVAALAERRGTHAEAAFSMTRLDAEVSGNSVGDQVLTGDVSLGDRSISHVSGVFVATFNTGNNVVLQTNVNLNVTVR